MRFEWDPTKDIANIEKHGISFKTAVRVFEDPQHLELFDVEHSYAENRYIAIGKVEEVLFVVFTERTDAIRIISARLAEKRERRLYENGGVCS